jgi:hypothetical protein
VIRIPLTDAETRRLEQASLRATDRKLRDRVQIVRPALRGRPHRDVAADLRITPAPSSDGSTPLSTAGSRP